MVSENPEEIERITDTLSSAMLKIEGFTGSLISCPVIFGKASFVDFFDFAFFGVSWLLERPMTVVVECLVFLRPSEGSNQASESTRAFLTYIHLATAFWSQDLVPDLTGWTNCNPVEQVAETALRDS